ncbi:MAG TPA: phosphoribosylformylglycinamidine cyclo-ligase [Acidimicrobiia bacterium]|jgi:phosphoribosylformylglycinamidine cyclo-ligase|nr:phosphoribosylformylglycinamidine cyclo-ligase [Acidimicrobiia bacterium]
MATYRDAGVDLDAADAVVDSIATAVTATWGDRVTGGFGGFAAGVRLPPGYADPILMMSTDGVGTKAEVARRADHVEGLGWDLVAMCIDDLVAAGARPIAMTDYLAVGRIDVDRVGRIVRSIAAACEEAGVALLGGETAEHPGVMEPDAFDLAGAALGVVEAGAAIDGSKVKPGDVIVGVGSPNVRANGFSLIRKVVLDQLALDDPLPGCDGTVAEVLLEPSVLYSPAILAVVGAVPVHGLAHITGGGLPGNLPRILPEACDAQIDPDAWVPPAVFAAIQQLGNVPAAEMYRTFNMGIGFTIVLAEDDAEAAINILQRHDRRAGVIGSIIPGSGTVRLGG